MFGNLLLWLLVALTVPTKADGVVTACPAETTFQGLISCLLDSNHMPGSGSNGFVVPNDADLDAWYNAVADMLDRSAGSSCGNVSLQGSLASLYEYFSFEDGESYCILAENALVAESNKRGWGTFITRLNPTRDLHFQVPHPLNDVNTGVQNAAIFEGSGSRSFLLTGTHRNANSATSSCQNNYKESDAAHNVKHMFQPTTKAIQDWQDSQGMEFVVFQMHGFTAISCTTDFFLTYGRPTAPSDGDCLDSLKLNLQAVLPGDISVAGEKCPDCVYNGGSNVQGRLLNGQDPDKVCDTSATTYSGRFIHIEQERQYRDNSLYYQDIINAITSTFPTGSECSPELPFSGSSWTSWLKEKVQGAIQLRFFNYEPLY